MKKDFHVFFLFTLFLLFAVNAAWAATLCPDPLQEDANGGCYINMVKYSETFNIPEGVTSFKVYDDGGKDGNCTSQRNATFFVAEGYAFQISGTITTSSYGRMSITDWTEPELIDLIKNLGYNHEGVDVVENVISSSNRIDIYSYCFSDDDNIELDITVSLFIMNRPKKNGMANNIINDTVLFTNFEKSS